MVSSFPNAENFLCPLMSAVIPHPSEALSLRVDICMYGNIDIGKATISGPLLGFLDQVLPACTQLLVFSHILGLNCFSPPSPNIRYTCCIAGSKGHHEESFLAKFFANLKARDQIGGAPGRSRQVQFTNGLLPIVVGLC